MRVLVVQTHEDGKRRADDTLSRCEAVTGELKVHFAPHRELHRELRVATLQTDAGRPNARQVLTPLFEPIILTLGNSGMMIQGFEEIRGRRLYQGWWVRFLADGSTPKG